MLFSDEQKRRAVFLSAAFLLKWGGSGRRLLLGDAVNGSPLDDKTAGIDTDDLLSGEAFAQDSQRSVIFFRLHEDRHDDGSIANEEVSIAGRQLFQTPSLSHERLWHGQWDDFHATAVGSA